MNHRWSFLAVLIVVLVAAATMRSQSAAEPIISTDAPKIKALLEQRRDVLAKRVELFTRQFQGARSTMTQVIEARVDLFAAELDLAETRDARIALLESQVSKLKKDEELSDSLRQAARGDESTVLLATSRRLSAEIALERELIAE